MKEEYIVLKGETLHGIFPVSMALEAGHRNFHKIYYCANSPRVEPLLDVAMDRGIEVSPVSFHNLERLCSTFSDKKSVHQGVVADVDRLYPLKVENHEVLEFLYWVVGHSSELLYILIPLSASTGHNSSTPVVGTVDRY